MTFFTFLQKNIIFSQLFCTFAFTKREESEMLLAAELYKNNLRFGSYKKSSYLCNVDN